jgi:hypothetical protein
MERSLVMHNERTLKQINNNLLEIILEYAGVEVSLKTIININSKFKDFVLLSNKDQLNIFKEYKNRLSNNLDKIDSLSVFYSFSQIPTISQFLKKNLSNFLIQRINVNTNDPISILTLFHSNIKSIEAIHLAEVLKVNSSIKDIYLASNNIDSTGAITLAEALKVNSSIKNINLSYNKIDSTGIIALAEALKVNSAIKNIYLNYLKTDWSGIIALAEALKINSTITIIHLASNNIDSTGAIALAEALKLNSTIK